MQEMDFTKHDPMTCSTPNKLQIQTKFGNISILSIFAGESYHVHKIATTKKEG